jgi:hypothetical protein
MLRTRAPALALLAGAALVISAPAAASDRGDTQAMAQQSGDTVSDPRRDGGLSRGALEPLGRTLEDAGAALAAGDDERADALLGRANHMVGDAVTRADGETRARLRSVRDQVDAAEKAVAEGDIKDAEDAVRAARRPIEDMLQAADARQRGEATGGAAE